MPNTAPHPGSLDTFEALANGREGLERFRILHDFGQYVLNGVQGDILEIGVGESSFFLSRLGERFKRRIFHCDISPSKIVNPMTVPGYLSAAEDITYIEERDLPAEPFVHGKRVLGFAGSSDALFKRVSITPIAFAFIDGDHRYDQAKKDFWNIWDVLVEDGVIALHDTHPPSEEWIDENRCGDVYRLRQDLKTEYHRMEQITLTRGCAIGVGITFIRKKKKDMKFFEF